MEHLKRGEYKKRPDLEKMAIDVIERYHEKKGEPAMLDIGSILEKSQDPVFVRFRECRDAILKEGKEEGIKEGIKEGMKEGEKKGEIKGEQDDVIEALKVRFNKVPEEIKNLVRTIEDLDKLSFLHRSAITIESMEAFSKLLPHSEN